MQQNLFLHVYVLQDFKNASNVAIIMLTDK